MNKIITRTLLSILLFLTLCVIALGQNPERPQVNIPGWEKITTTQDLYKAYPKKIHQLISAINLNYQGLEDVKKNINTKDTLAALNNLVDHFRKVNHVKWLTSGSLSFEDHSEAEKALHDVFTFQRITDTVPELADDALYWRHYGPLNDKEWCYFLNRHGFFNALSQAYQKTNDDKYVEKFDQLVRDWVLHNPAHEERTRIATWRILEVGLRLASTWPASFYTFNQSDSFTPAGILLMLSSIPEQAEYIKKYHENFNNRAVMELNGLALAAIAFPEFKSSADWYDYANERMMMEIEKQVYPDGAQDELTSHYHLVALRHFFRFAVNSKNAGHSLSEEFLQLLEKMGNYLAYVLRPDGTNPLNSDSDKRNRLDWVKKLAKFFDRKDWLWIASQGSEGTKPEQTSVVFPWAGQVVMRDDWSKNSNWAFFDIGPWGTGHQHNDKLHISIYTGGRDVLVDAGRFAYLGEVAKKFRRPYALHSKGHNVLLINNKGQNPGPRKVTEPLDDSQYKCTSEFDFARGSFNDFNEQNNNTKHKRAVLYLKNRFWIIVDKIESDQPKNIKALWHYHPDCSMEKNGSTVSSQDPDKGNITILPVGNGLNVNIIKGQEDPEIQGWYSEEYNQYEPSPVAIYETEIEQTKTFSWLLIPSNGEAMKYSASIIEENENTIKLSVQNENEEYVIEIPFDDNNPVIQKM